MSDFMLWLHANYIRPQIDKGEKGDYDFHFDLVGNSLPFFIRRAPGGRSCPECR